jgi:hypothetical protein
MYIMGNNKANVYMTNAIDSANLVRQAATGLTPEMIAAGVSVMEMWAAEQEGPISPLFESLVICLWRAMESTRLEKSLRQSPASPR